jgi:hypothetical protein
MTGLSISQKGLLEMATELKRLIEEARIGDNTELIFDLELELDEIEDAMHRAYRVKLWPRS